MPTGLPQPVPVSEGGTGAKTAADALDNFGLTGLTLNNPDDRILEFDLGNASSNATFEVPASGGFILGAIIHKTTTGDPTGAEGVFCLNTFDKTLKVYGGGAWRTITITWP